MAFLGPPNKAATACDQRRLRIAKPVQSGPALPDMDYGHMWLAGRAPTPSSRRPGSRSPTTIGQRPQLTGVYCFQDLLLGRLVELAGDDATIIFASGYGFRTGESRPVRTPSTPMGIEAWHRPAGMIAMRGPMIRGDEQLVGASILDIAPTVLMALGVPFHREIEGHSWRHLLSEPTRPRPIGKARIASAQRVSEAGDPIDDRQLLQRLGYDATGDLAAAIRAWSNDNRYSLARSFIEARRFEEAIEILEALIADDGDAIDYPTSLAQVYFETGRLADCRRVVEGLIERGIDTPLANVAMAALAFANRDLSKVLALLEKALVFEHGNAGIFALEGQVYARLRRWPDAERLFQSALDLEPDNPTALDGMALVCLALERNEDAADWALRAIDHANHLPMPNYRLGIALQRLRRPRDAVTAFESALKMDPNLTAAHHRLAGLYQHDLSNIGKALEHQIAAKHARRVRVSLRHERRLEGSAQTNDVGR